MVTSTPGQLCDGLPTELRADLGTVLVAGAGVGAVHRASTMWSIFGEWKNRLSVNACCKTKGFWARPYWYIFLPIHHFIFVDLIKQIERRSYWFSNHWTGSTL